MERIDLLSTGGALPWAGPLACSLAWLPCGGLSFSSYPPLPPSPQPAPRSLTLTLSLFALSAWRLPLLQLTLVLPLLGEMCAELLTPGLIFLLFPISFISSSWRHQKRQRMGGGMRIKGWGGRPEWKGEEGEYCQLTSPLQTNNVWCSGGIENTELTVLLVVGERSFAQLLLIVTTQHQKLHFLMLLTAVVSHKVSPMIN